MLRKRKKRKKRRRLMICWPTSMILLERIIGRILRGSWRWVLEEGGFGDASKQASMAGVMDFSFHRLHSFLDASAFVLSVFNFMIPTQYGRFFVHSRLFSSSLLLVHLYTKFQQPNHIRTIITTKTPRRKKSQQQQSSKNLKSCITNPSKV
jgi:hypothetical protein